MALRQTYLSLKKEMPEGAQYVLVMRGRGNDELAPSKELLDEFNAWRAKFEPGQGYETEHDFAWAKSDYEKRFRAQIKQDPKAQARLRELAEASRSKDVFLICYEAYDKPCHRKLLLRIAEEEFGAVVDHAPYLPNDRG
jgi:uncharacterized protein YeaO (DUF488 family)